MTDQEMKPDSRQETRVLVIDDEEIVHASVGKILARAGFQTTSVYSAREGLEKLRQEAFQLVITDLMMPEMNGIEMLQALQTEGIRVPIVMITGYPTIKTALVAMRLGATDYLAKPFTRKELLSPVKRALRLTMEEAPPEVLLQEKSALKPGDVVYLPHHAWARFEQDGIFALGVEASFLDAAGSITTVIPLEKQELVDQGAISITLINEAGEEHGVAMPLTGQVMEVNEAVKKEPHTLDAVTWVMKLLPSNLEAEIKTLLKK